MTGPVDIWKKHALQWSKIGPPLRPSAQDIDLLQQLLADKWATGSAQPRAVLLGVTPEIATMWWPPGTRLIAVDCNPGMIGGVWPGNPRIGAAAVCAKWASMPVGDGYCDVVLADGCFSTMSYPEGYDVLGREIRRVLKPSGAFTVRVYDRPGVPEPLAEIFEDLWAGRIGNFHVFKWRLAMALHGDIRTGVCLADIWNAWHAGVPEPEALAAALVWPMETIRTIDAYRGNDTRYTFTTLEEFRSVLSPYFSETACLFPDYELGDRCPTMLLGPRHHP
jgi:SAM-dependent methyltransferase